MTSRRNLKARVSWSTSFGRPAISNLMPNEIGERDQRDHHDQQSRAAAADGEELGCDARVLLRARRAAFPSAGSTRRSTTTSSRARTPASSPGGADNGYNGEYAGFTRLTTATRAPRSCRAGSSATSSSSRFCPACCGDSAARELHGHRHARRFRRDGVPPKTGEVAGFIPKVGNASLSWRYRGFSTRMLYNFTGEHITSYSATSPALNLYRYDRKTVNLGLAYQLRPTRHAHPRYRQPLQRAAATLFGNPGSNPGRILKFVTVTAGVSGRF